MGFFELSEERCCRIEEGRLRLAQKREERLQREEIQDFEEFYRFLEIVFVNKDEGALPKMPLKFSASYKTKIASYFYDLVDADIKRRESEKE